MDCCTADERYTGRLLFIATLIWITTLSSCHSGLQQSLAKHYTEEIFGRSLRLANEGRLPESRRLVDSDYRSFPYISIADQYRYNAHFYEVFHSFYSPVKNYDSALAYADKNLRLIEENGLTGSMAREYAGAYSQKGSIYMEQNVYNDAFYYYSRSRLIAEKIHDSNMLAEYYYALGLLVYRQSRVPEAIIWYKRSLAEISGTPDNQRKYHQVQSCLNSVGFFYFQIGQPDSAWFYLKAAETYIEANKNLSVADAKFPGIALGVVYGNEAATMQVQGKFPEAEAMYKKSITINSQPGYDNNSALLVRLRLADFYVAWKKPDSAQTYINLVEKAIPTNYDDDKRLLWNNVKLTLRKVKADYYSAFGDKLQASISKVDFLLYKDSIDRKSSNVEGINMNDAFDRLEREYTFSLLQKENDVKKIYLSGIAIFLVMLGIIGWMILRNLRRTKKMVTTLKGLNEGIRDYGLELKRLLDELETKNNEKDRILRIVVHDLRNPLSGIGRISTMLANRYPDDSSYRNLMGLIRTACSDTLELIGEILTATDAGQTTVLEKQWVDINTLVAETVELMRFNASEKQQTISAVLLGHPCKIQVDPEKIRRVLNNLISNAIKFSPPGKEISISLSETTDSIRIAVKDQGIGIAKKDQGKVFDMFTVARRSGTGGEKSFGLGLSICLQILEAHDGSIWLESEPGVGTTFYIGLKKKE